MLYQESNANSVAWNTEMEDTLAYSGGNNLWIKSGRFSPYVQKLPGFVVGFKGNKIFCLHYMSMQTIDVPQSASLYQYIVQNAFDRWYKVACLGVTD
jgi:intraflagellar transport protein 122